MLSERHFFIDVVMFCKFKVNASDVSVDMSGYLHLWKDRKWKKMWFVLKQKVLYTFKASEVSHLDD